jgi:hypothetical protein
MRNRVLPARFALRGRWRLTHFPSGPRGSHLFATAGGAGFIEGLFDRFAGFPGALLDPSDQFLGLAFGEMEIVIRELGPFLFELALGDVPVAFDFEGSHNGKVGCICRFWLAIKVTGKVKEGNYPIAWFGEGFAQ